MTTGDARALAPSTWMPGGRTWIALGVVLAVGLLANWLIAAGLMILALRQLVRPFDFLTSFMMIVGGAAFLRYEAGYLTLELAGLSVLIVFMLVSYAISHPGRWLALPRTKLMLPVVAYAVLSLANYARGVLSGHSLKYASLEILPVLALFSSLVVANAVDPGRDLRKLGRALLVVGFASASLGYYFSFTYHARAAGVWFTPVPGIAAMLAINLALRSPVRAHALGWGLVAVPLLIHQFLSFTRGMWLGCLAGLIASVVIYAGWGRGSGARLRHAGFVFGSLLGITAVAALAVGPLLGMGDLVTLALSRFGSITGSGYTHETASKVARLAEYATAIPHILSAPWFGHGFGYTFLFQEPIGFDVVEQWYMHEIYLMVMLKQGLLGLLVFLWMLWTAVTVSVRASRRGEGTWRSAWPATAAVCTILLAVMDTSNFQLSGSTCTFPLALLWGGMMAIDRDGSIRFRWADRAAPPGDA